MYEEAAFPELKAREFSGSWLDWFLKEIETFHGAFDFRLTCSNPSDPGI